MFQATALLLLLALSLLLSSAPAALAEV